MDCEVIWAKDAQPLNRESVAQVNARKPMYCETCEILWDRELKVSDTCPGCEGVLVRR